ncbi:hypothetical protein [Actinoplanes xinjiangensis]|uniref:Uncharacterized protein n=1 Tax=Actinoplanes xinjiangensis TaxID=512350 RepID=A0A316F7K3_9ACTN|nr:hypothetical protein [Actinoplanes xinjiangensis]PWK40081.1 hypothetical protein BC793_12020 [Actinoplanes xinjiangensis]GIF42392.1 hypothetical protein Axi01nite_67030 [Actinoplanes xinjiangensis]
MTERPVPSIAEAAALLLGILLLSGSLVAFALATAKGLTQVGPYSYEAEFSNPIWVWAGMLLIVPVFLAARRHPGFKGFFALAALIPQFIEPAVEMERYAVAGYGEGLPALGFIWPIMLTPLFIWAATRGGETGAKRRAVPTLTQTRSPANE